MIILAFHKKSCCPFYVNCCSSTGRLFFSLNTTHYLPGIIASLQPVGVCLASVTEIREDLSISVLMKDQFPYFVNVGVSAKSYCRGCGYKFKKEELRLRTALLRKYHTSIRACNINICLKSSCINRVVNRKYEAWVRNQ